MSIPKLIEKVNVVCVSDSDLGDFHMPITGQAHLYEGGRVEFKGRTGQLLSDSTGLEGIARTIDIEMNGRTLRLYTDQPAEQEFSREDVLASAARHIDCKWRGVSVLWLEGRLGDPDF